ILFIVLLKILKQKNEILPDELDFINTISFSFNISDLEYNSLIAFAIKKYSENINYKNVLIISSENKTSENEFAKYIYREKLKGKIYVLNIVSVNIFIFYYDGNDQIFLNGREIT
nr:hypothetical protein [Bacteroidales bacterium]